MSRGADAHRQAGASGEGGSRGHSARGAHGEWARGVRVGRSGSLRSGRRIPRRRQVAAIASVQPLFRVLHHQLLAPEQVRDLQLEIAWNRHSTRFGFKNNEFLFNEMHLYFNCRK